MEMLSDLDEDIINSSLSMCLSSCKFYPTISEIRENAMNIIMSKYPLAIEEWYKVVAQIKSIGAGGVPEFDNKITATVVNIIGWNNLCFRNELEVRLAFVKLYESYVIKTKTNANLLTGNKLLTS
jgi:hypothetical protein